MTPEQLETLLTIGREITVNGLLITAIWALVTGRLVTRWHYEEMRRLYEERIERLRNGTPPNMG